MQRLHLLSLLGPFSRDTFKHFAVRGNTIKRTNNKSSLAWYLSVVKYDHGSEVALRRSWIQLTDWSVGRSREQKERGRHGEAAF